MENFIIGIGGTGAKFVEAFTHCSAVGLLPSMNVHVMFIDPDHGNGNLERARQTVTKYMRCRRMNFGARSTLFKTQISTANPDVWSPIDPTSRESLNDLLRLNSMVENTEKKSFVNLLNVLYTADELSTTLERGFRGHPAIGAAVLAKTMNMGEEEPWVTFKNMVSNRLESGNTVRIFIAASIFGGTGASGFPTVAELIRKEFSSNASKGDLRIGGALILPYFTFIPDRQSEEADALRASSEEFLMNTQASLDYYINKDYLKKFYNTIYLIGDDTMTPIKEFSIGANTQKNDPHYIELLASLAASSFFRDTYNDMNGSYILGRKIDEQLNWDDLACANDHHVVKSLMAQFTRFAHAYTYNYYPDFANIRNNRINGKKVPFYQDFFLKNKCSMDQQGFNDLTFIREYCEDYLNWMGDMHSSISASNLHMLLFNPMALQPRGAVNPADTFSMLLAGSQYDRRALAAVWNKVNTKDPTSGQYTDASIYGMFLNSLYNACQLPL